MQRYLDSVLADEQLNQSEIVYAFLSPSPAHLKSGLQGCNLGFPLCFFSYKTRIAPPQVTTRRNSKFSPFSNLFNRSGSNTGSAQGSGGAVTTNAEDAAPPSIDNKDNLELLGDGTLNLV